MTRQDRKALVEEARKLLDGITPGEWSYNGYNCVRAPELYAVENTCMDAFKAAGSPYDDFCRPAQPWRDMLYASESEVCGVPAHHGDTAIGRQARDAEFIAAAPRLVRSLLSALEAEPPQPAIGVYERLEDQSQTLERVSGGEVAAALGAEAAPAADGWQPIEAAPLDSPDGLLVAFIETSQRKRPRPSYVAEAEYRNGMWWQPHDYDAPLRPQPTHYRPMPDPPARAVDRSAGPKCEGCGRPLNGDGCLTSDDVELCRQCFDEVPVTPGPIPVQRERDAPLTVAEADATWGVTPEESDEYPKP